MPERLRRKTLKVLAVEDRPEDAALIRRALRRGRRRRIRVTVMPSLARALGYLDTEEVDLVLLDLGVADADGVQAVRHVRRIAPKLPIVVIADEGGEKLGIQALQRDAQDYLLKHQLNPTSLTRAVRYALEPSGWQGQYRRLLSISPDGVMILDGDGRVLFINSAAVAMLGTAPSRVTELPPAMRVASSGPMDIVLNTGRTVEIRELDTYWSERPARLVTMRDTTQRRAAEQRVSEMARQLRTANERLEQLVGTDPLTHVLNRRGIEDALGSELQRMGRTGDGLMAILIDCDNFKGVNDSFGHGVGDAALEALSRSVEDTLRAGDHIGRVGGDEFLVLLPSTTVAEGMVVAEKLRQAVKATVLPLAAGARVRLSASLGVGPVRQDVVTVEEVLESLHQALKRSKEAGKDLVSDSGEPGTARTGNGGSSAEPGGPLRLDPASIPLDTVVQGIRRLDDGRPIGYEALTRGPAGTLSMPSDLFRTAFEQNVLTSLDLKALRVSVDRFARGAWGGWFHVNVFPSTLLNTPPDRVIRLLERSGTRERICIELSEQQFLGDPVYLRRRTLELQEAGFRIGIDDVGFGRSSVEALMVLDPDVVKVDRRCIETIGFRPGDHRQLERLLGMLRAVGATVIVEGIETDEQLHVLRELGVSYGQGFLWGTPSAVPRPLGSRAGTGGRQPERPLPARDKLRLER